MYAIDVELTKDKNFFLVTVAKGDNDFNFKVTLDDAYAKGLSSSLPKEVLIKKAFAFLLDYEPPELILKCFNLKEIKLYFPSFEKKLKNY